MGPGTSINLNKTTSSMFKSKKITESTAVRQEKEKLEKMKRKQMEELEEVQFLIYRSHLPN